MCQFYVFNAAASARLMHRGGVIVENTPHGENVESLTSVIESPGLAKVHEAAVPLRFDGVAPTACSQRVAWELGAAKPRFRGHIKLSTPRG